MKRAIALMILATAAWSPASHAAASCSLSTGGGRLVDFSVYNPLAGQIDAQGSITMNCSGSLLPIAYSVSIGTGSSGSFSTRTLRNGGNSLNYNLYTDATRLIIWGDGSSPLTTSKKSGTCLGSCSVFVYGRMFGSQSAPVGTYSDSVLVTLEF